MYELEIHYLDVGQGDCTIILVKNELDKSVINTTVIDCGTKGTSTVQGHDLDSKGQGEIASMILENKLSSLGAQKIHNIIITHHDKDHYNGFVNLFERLKIAQAKPNKGEDDIKLINLLADTKIYDPGIRFRKTPSVFDENIDDWTSDTGFDIKTAKGGFQTYFSGHKLYTDFLHAIRDSGMLHITERIFVGDPAQYEIQRWLGVDNKPQESIKYAIHPHAPESPTVKIQKELWESTCSTGKFISEKILYGPRNKDKIVSEEAYKVTRDSHYELIGQDILYDVFGGDVQLICVAANGFVAKPTNTPNKVCDRFVSYEGTPDDNVFSLGFVLKYGNFVHWFGGDLESSQEDGCIDFIKEIAPSGISAMKASHHGSNKSTSPTFLSQLQPKLIIISAGSGNRLPGIDTLLLLATHSDIEKVLLTGVDGYLYNQDDSLNEVLATNKNLKKFPTFYSITDNNSKFELAGSLDDPGDIKVTVSPVQSQSGCGEWGIIRQNSYFLLKETIKFTMTPMGFPVTIEFPQQILLDKNQTLSYDDDSGYYRSQIKQYSRRKKRRNRFPYLPGYWDHEETPSYLERYMKGMREESQRLEGTLVPTFVKGFFNQQNS